MDMKGLDGGGWFGQQQNAPPEPHGPAQDYEAMGRKADVLVGIFKGRINGAKEIPVLKGVKADFDASADLRAAPDRLQIVQELYERRLDQLGGSIH